MASLPSPKRIIAARAAGRALPVSGRMGGLTIDGAHFPSIAAACRHYDINRWTTASRARSRGISETEALLTLIAERRPT